MRSFAREDHEPRPLTFETGFTANADGSVLVSYGNTRVICTAILEEKIPPFLKGKGKGWLTAEYSMLPGSTNSRTPREAARGKQSGRTVEIQRLIGRSLRAGVDLVRLGERSVTVDCDVIQADGGTRTASIAGGWVATALCLWKHHRLFKTFPLVRGIAAISVGVRDDRVLVDLDYQEDSSVDVDMNVVMTHDHAFVEIQGTGEEGVFDRSRLDLMLDGASSAVTTIAQAQMGALVAHGVDRTCLP